ncbi:flagellar hook assembly protein FlgD [Blastococcus sp. SYSU D00813]
MTTPVSGATTVPPVVPTTSVERPDQMGKDMFLQLLVAQMRYQDPNNPASTTEFMSQTATFSQVEKLEELSEQNASLLTLQKSLSAGALVGHAVAWTDENGVTRTGTVSSVRFGADEPVAVVGGREVPFTRLTEVSLPASS